ncbi:hypothetical protein ACLB2K_012409 [Fragaria x ananassa]
MAATQIPEVVLESSNGRRTMHVLGFGTASNNLQPQVLIEAVHEAIKLGYRHFDTASVYGSEQSLGAAIAQALELGLVASRDQLFITSKVWCNDAHPHLVIPALKKSLRNLGLEYLDLYLIHWPISANSSGTRISQWVWLIFCRAIALTATAIVPPLSAKPAELSQIEDKDPMPTEEEQMPVDFKGVWDAMEEAQRLGLTKSIGISNFSTKKTQHMLSFATIPPAVNQVEMCPFWQQKKLRNFCKANGILVTAFSPLGAIGTSWGANHVLESKLLNEIAEAHGKFVAQICIRWGQLLQ